MKRRLSHIDSKGALRMVDIGKKRATAREAKARAFIEMKEETKRAIQANTLKKGDVLSVAKVAGIMAAKRVWELIPLTHTIPVEDVRIDFFWEDKGLWVECTASGCAKTGMEMEALVGAGICALTVYDMAKAIERGMVVRELCLVYKKGGKSGEWKRG